LFSMQLFHSSSQRIMSAPDKTLIPLSGLILMLVASWFSLGYYHFDEHFQILEFAGFKLGLNSLNNMPWEYTDQMRPAVQPMIAFGVYRVFGWLGTTDPFFIAFFLRMVSGLLTFLAMVLVYKAFRDKITNPVLQRWFLLLSILVWFDVYIGVRFSSENWSGRLFAIALAWYLLKERKSALFLVFLGFVLGLSFLFRFQAAFLILGFIAWMLFILGILAVFIFRWKSVLTWSVLPFLLVHFAIGHKELRFLFPLVSFLPVFLILGMQEVENRYMKGMMQMKGLRVFMQVFVVVYGIMLLVVMFRPSDVNIPLYKAMYYDYQQPATLYHKGYNPYERVLNVKDPDMGRL